MRKGLTTGGPAARTRFFGRERELEHLTELVARPSLATLTGVGGAGKTRLAAEVAAAAPGEVCWVELAALTGGDEVAPAVAAALGRDAAGALDAVVDALSGSGVLLVLDNCEQVLDGAAALAEEVAARVPDARILATSREPLGVDGEHVVAVGALSEAAELFVDRARLVDWEFDRRDGEAIDRICRRLDGLPLAIELAAARTRSLTPAEIATHLERDLSVLERRRGPERHRTLWAAVDWSYRLLDERERLVFERVSVVASRCDLEAAQAICAGAVPAEDVLGLLDRLVERSLLRACDDQGGRTRYGMLETIREHARERLREHGGEEMARELHAAHYAAAADRAGEQLERRWERAMLLDGIESFPEVRAACGWAMARDDSPARAARLVAPLWALAHSRHATEIAALCEQVLDTWQTGGRARVTVLGVAATAHFVAGDAARARLRAEEAVLLGELLGRRALLAMRALALVSYVFADDPRETLARLDDVVETARAQGEATIAAEMTVLAAQALAASGEHEEAVRLAEAMRAEAQAAGGALLEAWSTYVLGTVLTGVDRPRAADCFRESLELARAGGYSLVAGNSLRQLGRLAGRGDEAAPLIAEAIERFSALDDRSQLWDALRSAAPVLAAAGRGETAALVLAGAGADPRARRVPPLEREEIEALGAALEPVGAAPRVAVLVPRVLQELREVAAQSPARAESPSAAAFRQDGELWTLAFDGDSVHLPDLKGLHDMARLLGAPDQELHCLDLAGAPAEARAQGHAGELVDAQARAAYKQRLSELREELELAEAAGDGARAERLREELEALSDHLGAAFGLGGRSRKAGDAAERARSAVTWRIRSALGRIEAVHPALGRHLRNSLSTGTYCVYRPERAVSWQL